MWALGFFFDSILKEQSNVKFRLTQALVNKYQIPADLNVKQQELVDEGATGLYLLVTKSGMKTFYLRYRSAQNGNKTTHAKLGRADDITLEQARHKVKLLRAEIAQGGDPQSQVKVKRNEMTYGEFMVLYFDYISSKRSFIQYKRLYYSKLESELGGLKVSTISKGRLVAFVSKLKSQKYSNAYCNRFLQLIKSSINVGINVLEVIDIKNPAVGIPLLEEEGRERFLDRDELARLMPVLANAEKHLVVPARVIRFLLSTGLRSAECRNCRFDQIDLEHKMMSIPASHAKSKRLDSIPLNTAALQVLNECDRSTPYPFANPATGKPYVSIKKSFKTLMTRAGLEGVTAHTCRHTAASLMINGGQSLYSVQRILRHSSSRVTEKYAHLSMQNLQGASDTISDQLLAASGEN
jgi:integrase